MDEQDHITLQLIRTTVAELPEEDRYQVERAAAVLRDVLEAGGDHALLALALVGAECGVARV